MPRWSSTARTELAAELRSAAANATDAAAEGRQAAADATDSATRDRDLAAADALQQQAAHMTADANAISDGANPNEVGYADSHRYYH
ncbi:hypothetical protein [Kitasatospora griseola]|uniref:hypothetical protein n=1 Tax=Kitasatospora griseola TaxID=2064 RepID=UPI00380DB14B